jgi:1-aminocyclopropane-1-carboxylate deaminase/D-cysteine desulfhydrase-like pyridoxal-dependent ACC family enzyme
MTPIEIYDGVYVKRDDMCFDPPAPPFAKCRGLMRRLSTLKEQGITTIGYTETAISMAGWGVAWACKELGMRSVIFDPQYKDTLDILTFHRKQWKKFGVTTVPIKAGRAKVNYYISSKYLQENFKMAVMLPLGLPFDETVNATCEEVMETWQHLSVHIKSVVCCVGSGTIAAGIWKGLTNVNAGCYLFGVMTRTGNINGKARNIEKKANLLSYGFFKSSVHLTLIDVGWKYIEESKVKCPFPCHSYYDLKAWEWLTLNRVQLKEPILFWNIGRNV